MKPGFWTGFLKRAAAENPLDVWAGQADDEQKAIDEKNKKPFRVDPRELSEGFTPDTWQRYWP